MTPYRSYRETGIESYWNRRVYGFYGKYELYDYYGYEPPKPKSNAQLARDQFETRWKK